MEPPSKEPERRNFYGRLRGKSLRNSQKEYLERDLNALKLHNVTVTENPKRHLLNMAKLAVPDIPIWLEIGFGGGEHMVHMAKKYPDIHLIGCEPYVNGIAMLLGKIRHSNSITNISIHPGDVRDLLDVLPNASIDKAFLNYPDPWPKTRHHRRRFVTADYLTPLARVMKAGAEFRVATDIKDYVRQTLEEVPSEHFTLTAAHTGAGKSWPDWVPTRYEQKALREGRQPYYLTFHRNAPATNKHV